MTLHALSKFKRHAPWALAWCVVSLAGAVLLARGELARLRDAFDTDARIAHRLLSQKAAQHDAALSTLALLRPADDEARPETRLPSVYPQIVSVQRRDRLAVWAEPGMRAAEAESRRLRRPALADVNFAKGRYQLVLGG